jgi:hypothetical protein
MPVLRTQKQEFGSRHRDSLRTCQTLALLPAQTSMTIQIGGYGNSKISEIYTHLSTKYFDQI